MNSLHEVSFALEQLKGELEAIAREDIVHVKQDLDTFGDELGKIERKEIDESAETLRGLSVELGKIERKEFSFLKTFGIEESEFVHSNFLAWLLDPSEDHGLGFLFTKKFLNLVGEKAENDNIDLSCIDFLDILIEREKSSEESRLDIRLMDTKGTFQCIIENKIFSKEGDDQTNRLYRDFHGICPNELFIFLTLNGSEKADNTNFQSLTYNELRPVFMQLLDVTDGDTKLLIKNYLNTLERLVMAEKFRGYSERTQLYFRYVKHIEEVKAAYEEDRKLLLSALEEGIKQRQWWDESIWKLEKTGPEISISKRKWFPENADFNLELRLRPWIEQPALDLFVYGSPATFSAKFAHIMKRHIEGKYPGKMAGDFVKHLTGVNKFLEKTMKFSFTEKDQVEKILKSFDEMVIQFEDILDKSFEEFNKK